MRVPFLLCALIPALAASFVACKGHGEYTQRSLDEALERKAKLKAAADFDLANTQFTSGNLDEAFRSIERSIENHDQVAEAHILRGRILLEKGIAVSAMDSFVEASKLEPDDPQIEYYKGVVQERVGQPEAALVCYQRALARDSGNPQYGMVTAETLIDLGRIAEAKDLLESAGGDSAAHPGYSQLLGHIAQIENRYDDALHCFERAASREPTDPALREDLARVQVRLGRFSEAEASLATALLDPAFAKRQDLQYLRACCLIEVRRPVEARALLLPLAKDEQQGENIDALVKLVDVAVMLEDEGLLRLASQRLVASAPQRPEGYLAAALLHRKTGDLKAALASAEAALARKPDDAAAANLKKLIEKQLASG